MNTTGQMSAQYAVLKRIKDYRFVNYIFFATRLNVD